MILYGSDLVKDPVILLMFLPIRYEVEGARRLEQVFEQNSKA